ncbi:MULTISPECIES: glycosyl hydrolase 115 family protein [unclassified Saccharicrinis]|uniref:glycosyl hydrolase 115 family protein n=1 Tax=unclassified Saccharicrinis TaxID=2646859 RepID=UPI003D34B6D1
MKKILIPLKILWLWVILFTLSACTNTPPKYYIIQGDKATVPEVSTIKHLHGDLTRVSGQSVTILKAGEVLPKKGVFYIVGTNASNYLVDSLAGVNSIHLSDIYPGKRGGIWAKTKLTMGRQAIVLAGSDVQGMQYAVYDYCKDVLEVDPYEYWTGKEPLKQTDFNPFLIQDKTITPPEIPILCYFENDVDELANLKEPLLEYDWESYTQMIQSLVRLKYNAIHLFDMLGRPEFFLRAEYKKVRPDYDIRISYIDSLINYAHDMGMMVQIDLALGYKIKPMDQQKADCWKNHKEKWLDAWRYYFEETPLAKADIFLLRPRNQVWDWEYKSSCGEDKIEVFNQVYAELGKLIDEYKPEAKKVAVCYSDGMQMFNEGFNPPKDWIVVWSDDGWGGFKYLPKHTKGYDFGTYMHAGYWLNHTVHDPYPEKIDSVLTGFIDDYGANKYCVVNGQQFRPFLLNIEAFSEIANNRQAFDGEKFYQEWAARYFGKTASGFAVRAMKKLHEAQFNRTGYVLHLWEVREAIAYLSNSPIERPGKPSIPHNYEVVETDYEHVEKRMEVIKQACLIADEGAEHINHDETFYHDYIQLPLRLYDDLLTFENCLHQMARQKKEFESHGDKVHLKAVLTLLEEARDHLDTIYKRSLNADKNPKWKGWYDPAKRRPNNGFPTEEMMKSIEDNMIKLM